MKLRFCVISVSLFALPFSGCVTFDHTLAFAPLENDKPLSSSSSYRDDSGSVIGPEEYEIIKHFKLEREATFPLREKGKPVIVDFSPDIRDTLTSKNADAAVNLQFRVLSIDDGSERRVRVWRELGEWTLPLGLLFLGTSLYYQPQFNLWAGGIATSAGIVELLVSLLVEQNGKTTIRVASEGDAVRFLE